MNSRDTLTIHDNLHALTSYLVLILSLWAYEFAYEFVYSSPVADKITKKKHSLQGVWRTLPHYLPWSSEGKIGNQPQQKQSC